MKYLSKLASIALLITTFSPTAYASTYDFSFTGTGVSGNGVIDTSGTGSSLTVTDVTGTISDSEVGTGPFSITGLSLYESADNVLFTSAPYVDFAGISVSTDVGGDFNIYQDTSSDGLISSNLVQNGTDATFNTYGDTAIAFTVTDPAAVPEPATMTMFALGLLGLAVLRRRKS